MFLARNDALPAPTESVSTAASSISFIEYGIMMSRKVMHIVGWGNDGKPIRTGPIREIASDKKTAFGFAGEVYRLGQRNDNNVTRAMQHLGYTMMTDYYKIIVPGLFSWPSKENKDRLIMVGPEDILLPSDDGTFWKITGQKALGISIRHDEVTGPIPDPIYLDTKGQTTVPLL